MEISTCVKYVGVNDHQVDLFEGQYKVPNGMSYNSYVILDEKIAVMDTVDGFFTEEWLNNVEQVLDGKMPDYLVIQHMEPDHAANVANFLEVYPGTTVVGAAYGAGSFRQHSCFLKKISQNHSGIHSEGIPVHGTVFPGVFRRAGITCGTTHRCGE